MIRSHTLIASTLRFVVITGLLLTIAATLPLRWLVPPTTAFQVRDGHAQALLVKQHWAPIELISPSMQLAVVASEDQRFPKHFGLDLTEIQKVLAKAGGPDRGASTISQQLIKNLYLWSGRSWTRKAIEAWLTLWLECFLPKQRILELYLNVVEFGPGVYGAPMAAKRYFHRDSLSLSPAQAALLAAALPAPSKMSVTQPSDYHRQRQQHIQKQMRLLGGPGYLPWL